ncbi:MAG: type I-B CRISPR-associated endonuclease Cas1 [Spirochaetes bacterium]|nr:type I-B CRISPR-associated endonuclease Cas1 [Spirochaetota bacterium]
MKDYYIFKSGRISRKDNSIVLETNDGNIFIPINDIDSLCFFGEIDINTKAMNFLAQQQVVVHFFNYYGWYTGSFYPREFLLSGDVLVAQVKAYLDMHSRTYIARQFVQGAIHGFITNIKRYPDVGDAAVDTLQQYINATEEQSNVLSLMGIEGNAHELYYSTFPVIIKQPIEFEKRVKHPPNNMMNALISFCNSLVYTHVIKELYKTQLNPTVSYLHEPSNRRFSLSLDVSEIFKPIYADRVIFDLLNNNMITQKHFDKDLNYCYLKEDGRKIVVKAFDDKINTTVMHKKLKRNVSYQKMIRLELYKLIKHLLNEEQYQSLRIWW